MQTVSPRATLRLMSDSTSRSPKLFEIARSSSTGGSAASRRAGIVHRRASAMRPTAGDRRLDHQAQPPIEQHRGMKAANGTK